MRILNIVYNAEIKYQQHIKLRKYWHMYFQSNFDPGKPLKGKTSERGRFLFFRSFIELCYSIFIIRNLNDKLISIIVPSLHTGKWAKLLKTLPRIFCNKLQVCSSISMPPNCCTTTLKFVPTVSTQNREINVVWAPWETCQNF